MIRGHIWSRIINFNEKYFPNFRNIEPVYLSNAVAGEVGEICSITKRMVGGGTNNAQHQNDTTPKKLAEEVVDTMIYLVLLLESQGIDNAKLQEIFEFKLNELYERMDRKVKQ